MSNSLDPDQVRYFVGPDLGPNCLQRLLADVPSRQRVDTTCDCHSQMKLFVVVLETYMANSVTLASDCLVHSVTMHTGLEKQKISA